MNTAQFLTRVRELAQLPDVDEDWTDAEILAEATESLLERYTQAISDLRAGYWLKRATVQMVPGQSLYRIPSRAVVQGLEKVDWSNDGAHWRQMSILTDSTASDFDTGALGDPRYFWLEGDYLHLCPVPGTAHTLRFSYYLRPSVLIPQTSVGGVAAFAAGQIAVAGDPTSFLTGTTMDVVQTTGCNEVALVETPITGIVSLGFGLWGINIPTTTDLSHMEVGQVCRAPDTTDQIPLPRELQASLVARTAAVVLTAKGDNERASVLNAKAESAIKRVIDMATPRVKNRPFEFKTRNTFLRRKIGNGWGWR